MWLTLLELAALILISLWALVAIGWGLVAMGKLLQKLSSIGSTLEEIKLVLQDGRNRADR
jgi:hypothetical protein